MRDTLENCFHFATDANYRFASQPSIHPSIRPTNQSGHSFIRPTILSTLPYSPHLPLLGSSSSSLIGIKITPDCDTSAHATDCNNYNHPWMQLIIWTQSEGESEKWLLQTAACQPADEEQKNVWIGLNAGRNVNVHANQLVLCFCNNNDDGSGAPDLTFGDSLTDRFHRVHFAAALQMMTTRWCSRAKMIQQHWTDMHLSSFWDRSIPSFRFNFKCNSAGERGDQQRNGCHIWNRAHWRIHSN